MKNCVRYKIWNVEWPVMPFGLANAPAVFRIMNEIFKKYLDDFVILYLDDFVILYSDDILIYSNSKEDHGKHLDKFFKILSEKKFYASVGKCDFYKKEIYFLGLSIGNGYVELDKRKITSIIN